MKPITYEETKEQERIFRERHPDWKHSPVLHSREEQIRLLHVWNALLQRQNGQDLDDGVIGPDGTKVERYFKRYAPVAKNVLLVGVGVGREVQALLEHDVGVVGVTLGPMNVAFASEMLGVELLREDAHAMEMPGIFDAIIACQTLEHSWAPLMLLIEFCRVLKPGGVVVIETPPSDGFTMGRDLHHALCPTPRQLEGLLLKAGFMDVKVRRCDGGHITLDDATLDVVGIGRKWRPEEAEGVEPTIRELTR